MVSHLSPLLRAGPDHENIFMIPTIWKAPGAAPGSSGQLWAALGSSWQLWTALGSSGQLWAASGSSGQLLAALGSSWQLWTAPGSSGQLLASLGSSSMEEMVETRTTSSTPLLYVVALSLCMLLTSLAFFVTFFAAVHSFFLASQYLILFLLFVHSFS